jgi:general secretion pathway protein C
MEHPYRSTAPSVPWGFVRWRRVLAVSAQLVVVVVSVACAVFTYAVTALASDRIAATPHRVAKKTPSFDARSYVFCGDGVTRLGKNDFWVAPAFVDRVLEEQAELMTCARSAPEVENGRVVGVRLFAVTPGSLLAQLGFEGGDRIETVNGWDITSPEKALEAYARLRSADSLTVGIERGGRKLSLHYHLARCIMFEGRPEM